MNPKYNNINYTDLSYINHINQSTREAGFDQDGIDMIDDPNAYAKIIRKNIAYFQKLRELNGSDKERKIYRELYELILEIVCVKQQSIRINGIDYPYELVRSRFLKLDSSHLEYVMESLNRTVTKITNIRSYLITALFNASATMMNRFNQEFQYDMFGGGWEKKGII